MLSLETQSAAEVYKADEKTELAKEADVNSRVEFGDKPVRCVCPRCNNSVVTEVDLEHSGASWLLAFALFMTISFLTFCVYPFLSPLFKDAVHNCPRCGKMIKRVRRFSCPDFGSDIVALRCGNCAVVLSKKYVVGLLGVVGILFTVSFARWYVATYGLPDIERGPDIDSSWEEFLGDCAMRTALGNPIRAQALFAEKYNGKTVTWTGRLNRVQEGLFKKNFIFVNMDPHQNVNPHVADLSLIYNSLKLDDEIAKLAEGDEFVFKSTLLELGRRGSPHLGVLWEANKTRDNAELPDLFAPALLDFAKPPIVHMPRIARKVADARRNFIKQRIPVNGQGNHFYIGDDIIGLPMHLQVHQVKPLQENKSLPDSVGLPRTEV